MNNKYFYFNEFCFLVTGKTKSAVYDLLNGDIYSLDKNFSKIMKDSNSSIEEKLRIANSQGISNEKIYELLDELLALGVGRFSDKKLFIDRVNLDFKENLVSKAAVDLSQVSIRITSTCDLDCFFCSRNNSQLCFPCTRKFSNSDYHLLKKDNIKEILKDTLLFGCDTVRFIGGDPFKEGAHFLNVLIYAAEKIKNVEVFTNLSSITNAQKEIIAKHKNIHLIFPFFGKTEKSFGAITQKDMFFKKVWENILDLKSRTANLTALILKRRDESVEDTIEFFKSNDVDHCIYTPPPLTTDRKIIDLFEGFMVKVDQFPGINLNVFFQNKTYNACLGRRITIDLNGDVKPCLQSPNIYGNIFEEGLRNILRQGKQDDIWHFTKDCVDGCKSCEYRYCCTFDCMVASNNLKGKMNAQYPFCSYNPHSGNWEDNKEVIHESKP